MKNIKEEHKKYLVLTLIFLCIIGCNSKQRIKNNIIENTITEKLNNNVYKIYTKIKAYSKIKDEDELFLNDAVEQETKRLCLPRSNAEKVNFHLQGMIENKNNRNIHVSSITAIISCKKPYDKLLLINNNDEKNQSLIAYGINFNSFEEMNNTVDNYIKNYQSNKCDNNTKLVYKKTLFQLVDDFPYILDESDTEMLDFLGYKINIDGNCN
ncbi:MAG: hypothetical protein AB8B80_11090 [Marinicellaceae bacterium]